MRRKLIGCLALVTACTAAAPSEISVPGSLAPATMPLATAPLPSWAPGQPIAASGSDLVYLERAWEPKDNLSIVAMPSGTLTRRLDTPGPRWLLVDRDRGVGYYPFATSAGDRTRTIIERIDLSTGASTMRIDAGEGIFGNGLYSEPRHTAQIELSDDGRTLAVVRSGVDRDESATRIELFDTQTAASLAAVTLAGKPAATVEPSLVHVGRDRFRLDRTYYGNCAASICNTNQGRDTTLWFDARLRRIAPPADCAGGRLMPGFATLVNLCGDAARTLAFFDERTLAPAGEVMLADGLRIRCWNIASDGTIHLISDRLDLFRVDGARRQVLDVRPIRMASSSWRIPFGPSIASAKTPPPDPAAQFGPDGRLAYLTWSYVSAGQPVPEDTVIVVDLASASVTGRFRLSGRVQGIHLSPDGARLYVLVTEGSDEFPRWLYGLDARDGRQLSRADVLGERYLRIATVATAP